MIIPMKSVTLLALASEEEHTLARLQELGAMQLKSAGRRSDITAGLLAQYGDACRARRALASRTPPAAAAGTGVGDGAAAAARTLTLLRRREELQSEAANLRRHLEKLEFWGDFRRDDVTALEQAGLRVWFCRGTAKQYDFACGLPDSVCRLISRDRKICYFFVAALADKFDPDFGKLPAVELRPDDDPGTLRAELSRCEAESAAAEQELTAAAADLAAVESYLESLREKLDFSAARDTAGHHGVIIAVTGYVPEPQVPAVQAAAREEGWGLLIADPGPEEEVPVLLSESRLTRLIKPLFDFLGIVPGYRELDVTLGIMFFFIIFYAMIIGDAGYGLLFFIVSLALTPLVRRKPALKPPVRLFGVLSVATIIWGACCGSWFGTSVIPGTDRPWPACEFFRDFTSDSAKQANVQLFCFILAAAQLSLGRIWKAVHDRNWRSIGDNFGWMLILWGNFLLTVRIIVFPGNFPSCMYWLYGAGFALVCLCGVNWRNIADVFQLPFSVIGSFTDMLSYIRLFAVGMAGGCIAASFNNMALDVCRISPWIIPLGAVMLLAGHLLNVVLGFMSVMVHAVRLNTLEFSNHTGLTWSGQAFRPFRKRVSDDKQTKIEIQEKRL